MLDHFVEQSFVGQDALDHDETDIAVGMGGISHISGERDSTLAWITRFSFRRSHRRFSRQQDDADSHDNLWTWFDRIAAKADQ
jgi:hypothetical protein